VAGTGRILIVDNDADIADLVRSALAEEGYEVAIVGDLSSTAIAEAIAVAEPDAVLLDGSGDGSTYGRSWDEAARLTRRRPRIPVVMFTAHKGDIAEATARQTERSVLADFAAVVSKPFDLDELLAAVDQAVSRG